MPPPAISLSCGYARSGVGWRYGAIRSRAARTSPNVIGQSNAGSVDAVVIVASLRWKRGAHEHRRHRDDERAHHELRRRAPLKAEFGIVAPLGHHGRAPVKPAESEQAHHERDL